MTCNARFLFGIALRSFRDSYFHKDYPICLFCIQNTFVLLILEAPLLADSPRCSFRDKCFHKLHPICQLHIHNTLALLFLNTVNVDCNVLFHMNCCSSYPSNSSCILRSFLCFSHILKTNSLSGHKTVHNYLPNIHLHTFHIFHLLHDRSSGHLYNFLSSPSPTIQVNI